MSNTKKPKIQRGRTGAGMSPNAAEANPGVVTGTREENAHGIGRHNRISMGGGSKTLTISQGIMERMKQEGKHLHYILDDNKGRLQQAKDAGYEHVVDEEGNNIYRNTGGRKQYLMALPDEWHKDDKALKRKRAAASLGKEASLGENEYSPTQSDTAVSSTVSDNMYS